MEIAYGGTSAGDRSADVRQRRWPEWPVANPSCRDLLLEVLDSGRWTVRGAYRNGEQGRGLRAPLRRLDRRPSLCAHRQRIGGGPAGIGSTRHRSRRRGDRSRPRVGGHGRGRSGRGRRPRACRRRRRDWLSRRRDRRAGNYIAHARGRRRSSPQHRGRSPAAAFAMRRARCRGRRGLCSGDRGALSRPAGRRLGTSRLLQHESREGARRRRRGERSSRTIPRSPNVCTDCVPTASAICRAAPNRAMRSTASAA